LKDGWKQQGQSFGAGDKPFCVLTKDNQVVIIDRFLGHHVIPPFSVSSPK
jgi:hypothetical protein